MHYVGIDHHRQYSHITLLDEEGEIVKSGRVANLRWELEKFLQGIEKIKAVIEAGRSSYTMVDVLDDMGIGLKQQSPAPRMSKRSFFSAGVASEGLLCREASCLCWGYSLDSQLLLREDEEEEGGELSQSGDIQALADHYLPDVKREPSLHSL